MHRPRYPTHRARDGETASDVAVSHGFDWQAWSGHPRAHIIDTSEMTLAQVLAAVSHLVD